MPLIEARMQTYLLIMGAWLVVAVATAIAYARLAAFGGRVDAHLGEPLPPARRRGSWAFPLRIATPLALASAAAVFVADFGLPHESGRAIDAIQDPQPPPVQLAQVPAGRPHRERARRPPVRRGTPAPIRDIAPVRRTNAAGPRVAPALPSTVTTLLSDHRIRPPRRPPRVPRPVAGPSHPNAATSPESAAPVAAIASEPPPHAPAHGRRAQQRK